MKCNEWTKKKSMWRANFAHVPLRGEGDILKQQTLKVVFIAFAEFMVAN